MTSFRRWRRRWRPFFIGFGSLWDLSGQATYLAMRREMRRRREMDDRIDRWHDTVGQPDGYPVELHDYLGMTEAEYGRWVREGT